MTYWGCGFNYDSKLADTNCFAFTNVSSLEDEVELEDETIGLNQDDFGQTIYPDDIMLKVVFKRPKIDDKLGFIYEIIPVYVHEENLRTAISEYDIENLDQNETLIIEGREYLEMNIQEVRGRE